MARILYALSPAVSYGYTNRRPVATCGRKLQLFVLRRFSESLNRPVPTTRSNSEKSSCAVPRGIVPLYV